MSEIRQTRSVTQREQPLRDKDRLLFLGTSIALTSTWLFLAAELWNIPTWPPGEPDWPMRVLGVMALTGLAIMGVAAGRFWYRELWSDRQQEKEG